MNIALPIVVFMEVYKFMLTLGKLVDRCQDNNIVATSLMVDNDMFDRAVFCTQDKVMFVATQNAVLDTITVTHFAPDDESERADVCIFSPVNNATLDAVWATVVVLCAVHDTEPLVVDDYEQYMDNLTDEQAWLIRQAWDLTEWS